MWCSLDLTGVKAIDVLGGIKFRLCRPFERSALATILYLSLRIIIGSILFYVKPYFSKTLDIWKALCVQAGQSESFLKTDWASAASVLLQRVILDFVPGHQRII